MKQRQRVAAEAIAAKDAAVAELKKTRKDIMEMESLRACKHAIKTYILLPIYTPTELSH